jgi:RHS repeat-associated protein
VANANVATTTYTYDANGNVTQAGGWSYVWDYLNRMLTSGYNNSTTTYAYDATGVRVLQTSTTSTTYYPNKYFSLASTTSGGTSWATSTNYIWLGDTLLGTIDQKLYNSAATGSAITRYVPPDHLGSTNVVTDASGTVAQVLDYYPYGVARVSSSSYPTSEKRQYIGQLYDQGTGLNYLNARYYNPQQGQFISQDSAFIYSPTSHLRDPQGLNSYSYSRDNPITLLDTSGLDYAYFAARPAVTIAGVTGYHIYETYSIDSQARANQLNIGLPIPKNVSKDNPFDFTLGFEPSGPVTLGFANSITLSVEGQSGNTFSGGGGDYRSAAASNFTPLSPYYLMSLGGYSNYAQLANASVGVGNAISSANNGYFGLGNDPILTAIAWRNYTNSNGSIGTVARSTGQSSAFNAVSSSAYAPGGGYNAATTPSSSGGGGGGGWSPPSTIGNAIGPFVGTYNFGPGVGTYNFGTLSWVK